MVYLAPLSENLLSLPLVTMLNVVTSTPFFAYEIKPKTNNVTRIIANILTIINLTFPSCFKVGLSL